MDTEHATSPLIYIYRYQRFMYACSLFWMPQPPLSALTWTTARLASSQRCQPSCTASSHPTRCIPSLCHCVGICKKKLLRLVFFYMKLERHQHLFSFSYLPKVPSPKLCWSVAHVLLWLPEKRSSTKLCWNGR